MSGFYDILRFHFLRNEHETTDRYPLILDILESIKFTDCVILGDFNFELDHSKRGYQIFKPMFDQFDMCIRNDIKVSSNIGRIPGHAVGMAGCGYSKIARVLFVLYVFGRAY